MVMVFVHTMIVPAAENFRASEICEAYWLKIPPVSATTVCNSADVSYQVQTAEELESRGRFSIIVLPGVVTSSSI